MKYCHTHIIGLLLIALSAGGLAAAAQPAPAPTPVPTVVTSEATATVSPEVTPESTDTIGTRLTGEFIAEVAVESVFVRSLPSLDVEAAASLFDDEWIEVIGRNGDGLWFYVRRPNRVSPLGWVLAEYLNWDFYPERLPLADFATGVVGTQPLTRLEPFAAYTLEGAILRSQPTRTGQNLGSVPPLRAVPILARNQDGSWLLANYFGVQGWISASAVRHSLPLDALYEPADLPPLDAPVVLIPVEIQQAQIDRLRSFIGDRIGLAGGLEAFWWGVYRGETMPCAAPEQVMYYPFTEADVRELPELQRYAPQLARAIDYLALARAPLLDCGVIAPAVTVDARNAAINARVIFDATLDRLVLLERNIVQAGR